MERLILSGEDWSYGPVVAARGFIQRWRGLRHSPPDASLLLRTRSVHSFGMKRPFLAVGLYRDGTVAASRLVPPRRLVYFPGCHWVLELPAEADPPPRGTVLEVRDG